MLDLSTSLVFFSHCVKEKKRKKICRWDDYQSIFELVWNECESVCSSELLKDLLPQTSPFTIGCAKVFQEMSASLSFSLRQKQIMTLLCLLFPISKACCVPFKPPWTGTFWETMSRISTQTGGIVLFLMSNFGENVSVKGYFDSVIADFSYSNMGSK